MNVGIDEQRQLIESSEGREYIRSLLEIVEKIYDDPKLLQSVLCTLEGIFFDTLENVDMAVRAYRHPKFPVDVPVALLRQIYNNGDQHITEASCFVLSYFLGKVLLAPGTENDEHLERFLNFLLDSDNQLSKDAIIYSL
jgi:hypothetical protein